MERGGRIWMGGWQAAIMATCVALSATAPAQETLGRKVYVSAPDEYSRIEVQPSRATMDLLRSPDLKVRSKATDEVLREPNRYNPAVLFAMADNLLERGREDEAVFWFVVANTRGFADARILTDQTAAPGVLKLRQVFGTRIREYLIAHLDVEWAQTERAIAWDRANPPQYDRRWLSLHGVRAVSSAVAAQAGQPYEVGEITVPKETWPVLDEENRQAMLALAKKRHDGLPQGNAPATGAVDARR